MNCELVRQAEAATTDIRLRDIAQALPLRYRARLFAE